MTSPRSHPLAPPARAPRPGLVPALLAAALATATPAGAGDCYVLSHAPAGLIGPPNPVRQGVPLEGDEACGVQAAIDMIQQWMEDCGVTGPGGGGLVAGGWGTGDPGEDLQTLLDDGNICREIRADPSQVGATASNPDTGNGPDGSGGTWSTFGHPGINITGPQIPEPDPNGSFASGGKTFDAAEVASLAGQLLHEYQHLNDPPASPGSQGEYEAPAYTYAAEQLCKVAGCEGVDDAVKEVACGLIADANEQLCGFCEPQVECEACEQCGLDVSSDCKGEPKEPKQPELPLAMPGADPIVSFPTLTQQYIGPGYAGTVSLRPATDELVFAIRDEQTAMDLVFDLDGVPGVDVDAQSFVQIDGDRLLVGGRDPSSAQGEVVEVVFDVPTASVLSVTTMYEGADFVGARDMARYDVAPGLSVVFVLDGSRDLSVYLPWMPLVLPLATPATAPPLATAEHVTARPIPQGLGPGCVVLASPFPEERLGNGTLAGAPGALYDVNLDGVIDAVF